MEGRMKGRMDECLVDGWMEGAVMTEKGRRERGEMDGWTDGMMCGSVDRGRD